MKRVAALAVISLAFLGACSSTDGDKTPESTSSPSASATDSAEDMREFTLADGTTVEFDRLGELPADMSADIQARFDAVLEEPTADNDNFGAFKAEAATVGSETGKYVGGLIQVIATCDEADVTTWAFGAQTMSEPFVAACDAADAKVAAQELADDYIKNAVGGPAAWILITQDAK